MMYLVKYEKIGFCEAPNEIRYALVDADSFHEAREQVRMSVYDVQNFENCNIGETNGQYG